MTSEVVLMNNKAVAVAADSVVTVAVEGVPRKTFTGVQKLFEISEGNPVAMMIYANAEIMGLPWKTVINNYIAKSKKLKFGTVKEYAEDFFKFIDKNTKLFPEKLQRDQYELMLKSVIHTIEARAQNIRNFVLAQENAPDDNELIAIAVNQIYDRVTLDEWDEPRKDLTCFPNGYAEGLAKKYAKQIEAVLGEFLNTYTLSESVQAKVRELPVLIVTKHYFPQGWPYSGIVFAGYGKDQVHPEICSYEVSNVIGGYIKRGDHIFSTLSNEEPVVIQPFAQDRMIRTLLYGIDPMLESLIIYKTFELVPRLMDQILGAVPDLTEEQVEKALEAMQEEDLGETINDFFGTIFQHQAIHHMVPIYSAIQALPEHELASTAESLVSFNSFQQRVSLEVETVGGDIDVAILTPSEGFVWVKKPKHIPAQIVS